MIDIKITTGDINAGNNRQIKIKGNLWNMNKLKTITLSIGTIFGYMIIAVGFGMTLFILQAVMSK